MGLGFIRWSVFSISQLYEHCNTISLHLKEGQMDAGNFRFKGRFLYGQDAALFFQALPHALLDPAIEFLRSWSERTDGSQGDFGFQNSCFDTSQRHL